MMVAKRQKSLVERLPAVRGRLRADVTLARYTWLRVGGPAEVLFEPADADDLASFLAACPRDAVVTVLGVGSNLLVRDGGIPGVVIRIGRAFSGISAENDILTVGAGATCPNIAKAARDAGVGGLEFLSGIPGSLGGAVRMNAGSYGSEIADVLLSARALDGAGACHELDSRCLGLTYRHSATPENWIFVASRLRGRAASAAEIGARMEAIQAEREASQPIRMRTGGSSFVNPPGEKAWELIERAGCRGLVLGAAQVSEKHCNFLINTGGATAAELEGLGEEVRRRVFGVSGIRLEWEISRIGEPIANGLREVVS
jgi:UDP-N-acetylmuramate dehydrogenase